MFKNIKVQKTLLWTLKLVLFVVVLYFFILKLSDVSFDQFQSLSVINPIWFVLVIFLLPINWGFEWMKWSRVLKVNGISFTRKEIVHSLFSGVTTGIVTPNRIGNFIGRMLFFKGKVRGQLILGTLYSNLAQFIVTLLFGLIAFIFLQDYFFALLNDSLSILLILFLFSSFFLYFSIPFLPLAKWKRFKRKENILLLFQSYAKQLIWPLLMLSGFRYLIFSTQFLLMLMAFGTEVSLKLYGAIFILYLVTTLTPNLILGKLIIRETAGLIILGYFIENSAIILGSSILLWIINIGIPSLVGLFFLLKKKSYANA